MTDPRGVHTVEDGPKPPLDRASGANYLDLFRLAARPVTVEATTAVAPGEGLSISEFAEWAGIDRRRLARHLVEVPPGPVPPLPPGAVPMRLFGKTRRIFLRDVFGTGANAPGEASDAVGAQEARSSATRGSAWDRPLDLLRRRGADRG